MRKRVAWAAVVILLLAAGIWALGIAPHAYYHARIRAYVRCVAGQEKRVRADPRFMRFVRIESNHDHRKIQMFGEDQCQTEASGWEDMFDLDPDTPLGVPDQDLPA